MTLQECTALLTPIALACRADMDEPTFRAYHRVLKDVPAALAEAALEDLVRGGLEFLPTAPKILNASELSRRRMLALHPYEGCADCEEQRGYRTVLGSTGQKTVERCPCRARHHAYLDRMGLRAQIAMLPGEAGVGASEPVYPTVEQLPTELRQQVEAGARRKVLR